MRIAYHEPHLEHMFGILHSQNYLHISQGQMSLKLFLNCDIHFVLSICVILSINLIFFVEAVMAHAYLNCQSVFYVHYLIPAPVALKLWKFSK